MNEKKDHAPLSEENAAPTETESTSRIKDAAEAAEYTQKQRQEYEDHEVGKEHPHEDKDTSYMDDAPPKLTIGKILRYIGAGIILLVFVIIFYRIHTQNQIYNDYFVWTDEAVAYYEEKGNLTVWIQDMSSFTFTLARDENNMPTDTYDFTYTPYSSAPYADRKTYEGCYMVSDPMYVEETKQFIITFRVNRTAGDRVKEHYELASTPSGDIYRFILSDGLTDYTDYEYVTFEKNTYFYYRLVFNDVNYDFVKNLNTANETDIRSIDLSIYYKDRFFKESPIETMTVANNLIKGDSYKIKKALPAEVPADIKKGPIYSTEEES